MGHDLSYAYYDLYGFSNSRDRDLVFSFFEITPPYTTYQSQPTSDPMSQADLHRFVSTLRFLLFTTYEISSNLDECFKGSPNGSANSQCNARLMFKPLC